MRVPSLLALAAAGALLLPMAANAGNFPAGKEAAYMTQCTQVAQGQGVDAATAKSTATVARKPSKEFHRRGNCRPRQQRWRGCQADAEGPDGRETGLCTEELKP